MEDAFLQWIRATQGKPVIILIGGRISGIHDWKRIHIPVFHQILGTTTIIYFVGSESLALSDAVGVHMLTNGNLSIQDAREVRFTWPSKNNPSRDCVEVFTKFGRFFTYNRVDDMYSTSTSTSLVSFEEKFLLLRLAKSDKQ